MSQCTCFIPCSAPRAVFACGKRWGGIGVLFSCSWSYFGFGCCAICGVGGFFWMTFIAAALACSFVSSICLFNISSALSGGSSSPAFSSSSIYFVWCCSFSIFLAGTFVARRAALLVIVCSYSLSAALVSQRVVFAGISGSSVSSGAVVVCWGFGSGYSYIMTLLGWLFCILCCNPAMSISAFFTAITIGVCAVAVSKFSIYRRRFLWFSTLKFTPATISKKSTVFLSFVIIG